MLKEAVVGFRERSVDELLWCLEELKEPTRSLHKPRLIPMLENNLQWAQWFGSVPNFQVEVKVFSSYANMLRERATFIYISISKCSVIKLF